MSNIDHLTDAELTDLRRIAAEFAAAASPEPDTIEWAKDLAVQHAEHFATKAVLHRRIGNDDMAMRALDLAAMCVPFSESDDAAARYLSYMRQVHLFSDYARTIEDVADDGVLLALTWQDAHVAAQHLDERLALRRMKD